MATTIKTTFQFRRGKAEVWAKNNPVLAAGEPAFELDTGKLKIGNGSDAYNNLPYLGADDVTLSGDDITITRNGNTLILKGYQDAEIGTVPQKTESGMKWVSIMSADDVAVLLEGKQDTLVSSEEKNKIKINDDKTMEITSVSVSKLDDSEDVLILNGGNA